MSTLTVTRVTHSCVLLDFAGIKILTDPWFSERPGYLRGEPLAYTPESLPHLDGVLVSHGHYDPLSADRPRAPGREWPADSPGLHSPGGDECSRGCRTGRAVTPALRRAHALRLHRRSPARPPAAQIYQHRRGICPGDGAARNG